MEKFLQSSATDTIDVPARLQTEDLIPDSRLMDSALDAFGHREIAGRVADIAISGDTPLNIALFGPWGSGKSSFFQMLSDALTAADDSIEVIRYDAWKFGGESLKRNFVSHAASELGLQADSPAGRPFHRGLYESVRSVDFNPGQFFKKHWKSLIVVFLAAVTVCFLFVAGAAGIWSAFSNVSFGSRFSHLAPGIFKYLGTGMFAVGALINVLATVNVEQTMPSEEERFADLFKELISKATTRNPKGKGGVRLWNWLKFWENDNTKPTIAKIVFFIDELDRCSKEDVVATLTGLRTFLDQRMCVFVVAADREVIEEALSAVEQSTPIREDEPYYSSASAFLDKIFQHQVALPPLRTGRLTRFAKDLVKDRGGLWADLRGAEGRDRLLNNVLYALVPAHVRSPRRVKVLLNNFATNIRVAESRDIDWISRATEIAKLTVLQTEFPRLATDLLLEPRLPTLLLHPPTNPTDRQTLLLNRHRFNAEALDVQLDRSNEEGTDNLDALLVADSASKNETTDQRLETLRSRQREDLRRYLTSREAADVPDPGRDLLYLEEAGKAVGLHDSDLSQLLEDYAADSPGDVRGQVQDRPPQTRIAAARMLGVMAERDFGPERQNVVTALAQALEGLPPPEFDNQLGDLIAHVTAYMAEEAVTDSQFPGFVALALGAKNSGIALRENLFTDERLKGNPQILDGISTLLPYFTPAELTLVSSAICSHHVQNPATTLKVLAEQPDATVAAFLRAGTVALVGALNRAEQIEADSGNEPDEGGTSRTGRLIFDVLDALEPRIAGCNDAAVELLTGFTADPDKETYRQVQVRAAALLSKVHEPAHANQVALSALSGAPISDWSGWASLLQPSKDSEALQVCALTHVLRSFAQDPASTLDPLLEIAPALLAAGQITDPPADVATSLKEGLAAFNYWEADDSLTTWIKALKLVNLLSKALPALAGDLNGVVAADIARAETGAWDAAVPPRIQAAGLAVVGDGLVAAATILTGTGTTPVPAGDLQPAITKALMTVTGAATLVGLDVPPVPLNEVLDVAQLRDRASYEAVAGWFDTAPPPDAVLQVVAITGTRGGAIKSATRWIQAQTGAAATEAVLDVLDGGHDLFWVEVFAVNADCRIPVLDGIAKRLTKATDHEGRLRLVQAVHKIKPSGFQEVKRVAEMTVELLVEAPSKAKVVEAAVLIPHLTGNYGMKKKVQAAVSSADAANRIDRGPRKKYENAGFLTPKKNRVRKVLGLAVDAVTRR